MKHIKIITNIPFQFDPILLQYLTTPFYLSLYRRQTTNKYWGTEGILGGLGLHFSPKTGYKGRFFVFSSMSEVKCRDWFKHVFKRNIMVVKLLRVAKLTLKYHGSECSENCRNILQVRHNDLSLYSFNHKKNCIIFQEKAVNLSCGIYSREIIVPTYFEQGTYWLEKSIQKKLLLIERRSFR